MRRTPVSRLDDTLVRRLVSPPIEPREHSPTTPIVQRTATSPKLPENLTELFARKVRKATATWGAKYIEDSKSFVWQPETFTYHDMATGHEVWKLSNGPQASSTVYHNDIGVSPWNADGSKMAFTSWDRLTQAYSQSQQNEYRRYWMTVDTNGRAMRPTVESSHRLGRGYFHWSAQEPNTWYEIGQPHFGSLGRTNTLYRSQVDPYGMVTSEAILTLPVAMSRIAINKLISADGRRLVLESAGRLWPITILPDGSARLDDADGYSVDRAFGPYGGMNGGSVSGFHDQYIAGTGDWLFVMPNDSGSTATWWRIQTTGTASDGGPLYTGDAYAENGGNHEFGEVWPENYRTVRDGNMESPFVDVTLYHPEKTGYWSHFVPDRWGTRALFSNYTDELPGPKRQNYGTGVWDIANHRWVVPTFGDCRPQHHDWHGFTDWTASSGSPPDAAAGREASLVLAQNVNDPNSQIVVNDAHTRYHGGTRYNSLIRPGQSPDGTKVAWHSEFLNGANATDIFWSVVHYPYPPTDLQAAGAGGKVEVGFLPPKYTDRGWIDPATGQIDEVHGETLYAREVKQYHVWRSPNGSDAWQQVATISADYASGPITNTLKPRANGDWVSESNRLTFTDAPGDGTWYYALTMEEHSGLESDELSEVIEVKISRGSVRAANVVSAQGQQDFWTTTPKAPGTFTATAESIAGHTRLNWTEPTNDKIRYYNIYYSPTEPLVLTGDPQQDQAFRIASMPAGTTSYLDWLADPSSAGFYGITAVDRYGNESALASGTLQLPQQRPSLENPRR